MTTGRISRSAWVRRLGELAGNMAAADEWGRQPARIDEAVLELSDEIRRLGIITAVLTNGTDTIPAELAELDITHRFDAIFNSAEIGFAKPDVRAFTHVLDTLGVAAEDAYFTDDSASKIVGAESAVCSEALQLSTCSSSAATPIPRMFVMRSVWSLGRNRGLP